jgi:flagellar protein FliJ
VSWGTAHPTPLQVPLPRSINRFVETPSFTFRLERVKSLRERAEERAQEDLANELRLRMRGEAMLMAATDAASAAVETARTVTHARPSAGDLIAAQAYIERAQRSRHEAALDLDRRDAEVAARRSALQTAARDRQVMDKLEERQRADHQREWARRAQVDLDEIALGVHRRGVQAAAAGMRSTA